jgi:dTDP-4-dehydrorhamnose 3,5-epimerase
MIFTQTPLSGSYIVELEPKGDHRGWFARTYCKNEFAQIGHTKEWVQLNHSYSSNSGTLRGMHFQTSPFQEIKMVRCISGSVFDVIIDLRKNSPTFLKWFGSEISAENRKMMYVPEGFAHGFQTLTDHCELIYHHAEYFTPDAEAGLNPLDPVLNIDWPLEVTVMSDRDSKHHFITEDFKGI